MNHNNYRNYAYRETMHVINLVIVRIAIRRREKCVKKEDRRNECKNAKMLSFVKRGE